MPLNPALSELALRVVLACAAGALIGFNREGRNQAAGLRTTLLVSLAACLTMILANLLLPTSGKVQASFAQIDVLRLPLGVLSGMGFLGAGAIIRRGDAVLGVTTAATLWFMTVVGLCFGAGELVLGATATALAFAVIWGLKWADEHMHHKQQAALAVRAEREGFPEAELRRMLQDTYQILSWEITYADGAKHYDVRIELEWRGGAGDRTRNPGFLGQLVEHSAVLSTRWTPQALSG